MMNPHSIGHALMTIGSLMMQVGAKIVQSHNELLQEAVTDMHDNMHAAYLLGRQHEREGEPVADCPTADVYASADVDEHQDLDEHQDHGEPADVDEHQDHGGEPADVDEHPSTRVKRQLHHHKAHATSATGDAPDGNSAVVSRAGD